MRRKDKGAMAIHGYSCGTALTRFLFRGGKDSAALSYGEAIALIRDKHFLAEMTLWTI